MSVVQRMETKPVQVIGAGFGRTGTMSMQAALERLGYRCYHMKEVPQQPGHLRMWHEFVSGSKPMDWRNLFAGYEATVDFPACVYYQELLREFPDAKVILSVRDPDRWYNSFLTLQKTTDRFRVFRFIPKARHFIDFVDLFLAKVFDNRPRDRGHCMDVFNQHNRQVQQHVPEDRLLVFRVEQGWEPLCAFLGCEMPRGIPFPHLNEGEKTIRALARQRVIGPWFRKAGIAIGAALLLVAIWWFFG